MKIIDCSRNFENDEKSITFEASVKLIQIDMLDKLVMVIHTLAQAGHPEGAEGRRGSIAGRPARSCHGRARAGSVWISGVRQHRKRCSRHAVSPQKCQIVCLKTRQAHNFKLNVSDTASGRAPTCLDSSNIA